MFSKVFESVRAHLRARADQEALMNLSDAALDDIGLTRGALSELRTGPETARLIRRSGSPRRSVSLYANPPKKRGTRVPLPRTRVFRLLPAIQPPGCPAIQLSDCPAARMFGCPAVR